MEIRTEGKVQCIAYRSAHSGRWIGECEMLGIAVEAENLDELHEMFGEAIALLLEDLTEDGELDEFLLSKGWRPNDKWFATAAQDNPMKVVPWDLVAHCETNALQQTAN